MSSFRLTPILLLPPAYVPRSVAALLAPVIRCFPSLSSCRTPAPTACVPVLRRIRCLYVFPCPSLVGSLFGLTADQVCI